MGRHATFGFPEGKRRSPDLKQFANETLIGIIGLSGGNISPSLGVSGWGNWSAPIYAHPIHVHSRFPAPNAKGVVAYSPGLRRRGATPGPGHIVFPTPQGVVPFVPAGGVRQTRAEWDRVLGCGRGVRPECTSTLHAIHTHHIPPVRSLGTTPLGLFMPLAFTRGSASAAQPRALWQNPVGIPGGGWGKV